MMRTRRNVFWGLIAAGCFAALSPATDENPPAFYLEGRRIFVGMSQTQAESALSVCCKLSPPASAPASWPQSGPPHAEGVMRGSFILSKVNDGILGTIFFTGEKVVRITRPLDTEIDTSNDNVVAFARAIDRALWRPGDKERKLTVQVSVRHERMTNAESDVLSLSFPNGRGIQIQVGTLDQANAGTNRRDFATLDEILEPAR